MNERPISPEPLPGADDGTDWPRVRAMTDSEIEAAIADDPDTFLPDPVWMENAVVVMPERKRMVTLRLDPEVLAWFRASGRGYQTRINAVLRAYVDARRPR